MKIQYSRLPEIWITLHFCGKTSKTHTAAAFSYILDTKTSKQVLQVQTAQQRSLKYVTSLSYKTHILLN